ncbi:hypothetical protein [Mesorhizobium sp.]|uniref:hypothetical protein n=1 Tax=Mesorhizobium sp. TaxID=1871066 RepID=UPI00338F1CC7
MEAARTALQPLIEKVWRYCENIGIRGRTVIRRFSTDHPQSLGGAPIRDQVAIEHFVEALLEPLFPARFACSG